MRAVCTIRPEPHYRRQAFVEGLAAAGYEVGNFDHPRDRNDILVIWNRQGAEELRADDWEKRGGTVLVCENGYMGRDEQGLQLYAISVHGHNGSGWFYVGEEDRFSKLGIELAPWVDNPAGHILVCAQRGIGSQRMASPPRWELQMHRHLLGMGERHVKIRQHPGKVKSATTLDEDLAGARACLIWSSASGLRALQLGVPVAFDAPFWVGSDCAAPRGLRGLSALIKDDAARLKAMHRAAWGQRTVAEIQSGEPFVTLREHLGEASWA